MIASLDSAIPPTAAQVAAAKAAGIAVWSGYLSTAPFDGKSHFGLYRPWSQAEFATVKTLPGLPIAYFSGWDSPAGCRALAAAWGVRLCLDVEDKIRPDGPWVQSCVDTADSGLYGNRAVHAGRRAAFHIASFYPTPMVDPKATWPAGWPRPPTPCGWQWWNTHNEFGVGVDRSWLDDSFGKGGFSMSAEQQIQDLHDALIGNGPKPNYLAWSGQVTAALAAIQKTLAAGGSLTPDQAAQLAAINTTVQASLKGPTGS